MRPAVDVNANMYRSMVFRGYNLQLCRACSSVKKIKVAKYYDYALMVVLAKFLQRNVFKFLVPYESMLVIIHI